jgi:molybdopterin/thiamine biosynthesis adenylyltransferase
LCLLPEGAELNPFQPVDVLKNQLGSAVQLIEDLFAGTRIDDFRDEFYSYWAREVADRVPPIRSLIRPEGPTRLVKVWRGKEFCVLAEQEDEIERWLSNRYPGNRPGNKDCESALLAWLPQPLLPAEYPKSVAEVRSLVREQCAEHLLDELLLQKGQLTTVVVIGADSRNGPCLGGILIRAPEMRKPPGGHATDKIGRGFRRGRVPRDLHVRRYVGEATLFRTLVWRADASWIHGRDLDERFPLLRKASVAVLGCGSVGAPVATLLARAGIGRLFLVDPEKLAWANVGRHVLGADSVGAYKAEALADRIRSELPHINGVDARRQSWEELSEADQAKLFSSDLIVSTMGNWGAEGSLNERHLAHGRSCPVVYGWTEAHGVAGHAVAICSKGGCLQCGVNETGRPLLRVVDWHDRPTTKQEPACGAIFQPYGPVDIGQTVNVIAELCLDCLLKSVVCSTHRIWAARKSLVETVGGTWSAEWINLTGGSRPHGGFVEERNWPLEPTCPECGATAR